MVRVAGPRIILAARRREQAGIFLDIYGDISPGRSVAEFDPKSGEIMGACFYHPRKHHVSLGVMSVSPDYFKRGVGRALVNHIVDFTESNRPQKTLDMNWQSVRQSR